MFEGTGLTALDLNQDPQGILKNTMGNIDESDLQKSFAHTQGKDDEIVTIVSRSRQIRKKLQTRKITAPPPGLNIAPAEDPSSTSGLTQ